MYGPDETKKDGHGRPLHNAVCYSINIGCVCLTCIHNKRVDDPETDTMCCDLSGHERECTDTDPCPDYERHI